MIFGFDWVGLTLLLGHIGLFFWGSALAAQATGKSIWLFVRSSGRHQPAALGFRAAPRWIGIARMAEP